MPLTFRRSVRLGKAVRLNFGKRSVGLSFGGRGCRASISTRGIGTSIGGGGLCWRTFSGWRGRNRQSSRRPAAPDDPGTTLAGCVTLLTIAWLMPVISAVLAIVMHPLFWILTVAALPTCWVIAQCARSDAPAPHRPSPSDTPGCEDAEALNELETSDRAPYMMSEAKRQAITGR